MYRMPENNQEVERFWTVLEVVFSSMQITYSITYFPSNWNILTFFYHFSICFVSFYIILCKLSSFMQIYAFKKKKTSRKLVFTTTAIRIYFASLTLICKLLFICRISLETKMLILNSQMIAFLGTLFILATTIL